MQPVIIAADKIIDNQGDLSNVKRLVRRMKRLGLAVQELHIEPLRRGWHSPQRPDHFRSGCAPIEALQHACQQIRERQAVAVVISGSELLRSGYQRMERQALMAIYGADYPLTQAYDDLAERFMGQHRIPEPLFHRSRDLLFDHYCDVFRQLPGSDAIPLPAPHWYQPLTRHFRGVDCANPMVDFEGQMVIASEATAKLLGVDSACQVRIAGVDVQCLEGDGPEYLGQIARYEHLQQAYRRCCSQAGVDFNERFRQGLACLEVYSCYPVVPMALLLVTRLLESLQALPEFLRRHRVTVTGGMNLARAPWNNPALNGLISMYHALLAGNKPLGLVHGNGGLGYRQGVALMERAVG